MSASVSLFYNLLVGISRAQSEAKELQACIDGTVQLLVPQFADICGVYLLINNDLVPQAIAHQSKLADRTLLGLANSFSDLQGEENFGPAHVMRTKVAQFIKEIKNDTIRLPPLGPEFQEELQELGLKSYIAVPLAAREAIIGAMTFSRLGPRAFDEHEFKFAKEISSKTAFAIANVLLLEELKADSQMKDEMCRIISHDLRSPLATAVMSLESLKSKSNPEEIEIIERSCKTMVRLTEDLATVGKMESSNWKYEFAFHKPAALLRDGVEIVLADARKKNIHLNTQIDANDREVDCDFGRIVQVIGNLLGNAIKFSPENATIDIHATWCDGDLLFTIEDNGPGINPENLCKIFEKYWQVDGEAKIGSGLGLYICKTIVSAHDGKIWAESDGQHGSCFHFSLPGTHVSRTNIP